MKKLFFVLLLFLSIFSLNITNTKALELTEDSTPEEIIQAMRETYPDIDKKDFVLFKHNTSTIYQYRYVDEPTDGYKFGVKKTTFGYWDENFDSRKTSNYINFNINNNPQLGKFSNTDVNLTQFTILYSSVDIPNSDGTVFFEKNYSFGGGEEPTPTPTPTPTELPFTREEFLLLPFLISLLIVMLFLKWCFPFKGGKNL